MAQKAILDNKALENIDLSAYLPKAGGTLTGRIYGNSGNGLEIQSLNTGPWKEGIRIYNNASNGFSVLSLCDESCRNCLALVQHSKDKRHYIDIQRDGVNKTINIPYKSGTMALKENIFLTETSGVTQSNCQEKDINYSGMAQVVSRWRVTANNLTLQLPKFGQYIIMTSGYSAGMWLNVGLWAIGWQDNRSPQVSSIIDKGGVASLTCSNTGLITLTATSVRPIGCTAIWISPCATN